MLRFFTATIFIAFLFLTGTLKSQDFPCGTSQMARKAFIEHPELLVNQEQLEEFTREYINNGGERVHRIIPVVFHVIHNYGSENISKAQILDAIRILNEDYQLLNEDQEDVAAAFASIIGDPDVEFRLAQKDPSGNCTEGITRTASILTFSADDNVKELISWPTNKYLNIWVVNQIVIEDGAGVQGYAYAPGNAPFPEADGVLINNRVVGSIGTSVATNFARRALTHEVGHYFNLKHTWGPTNDPGLASNCALSDQVNDTPPTIGNANQSCNLTQNTCGVLDNVQNYMDYSSCPAMFTVGQANRMQAALSSPQAQRNQLWTTSNLTSTGVSGTAVTCAPIADFVAPTSQNCTNTLITFNDASYNAEINGTWQWSWSFPGGVPSSSTEQNPQVQYPTPGSYSATLTVITSAGNSSITKTQYIQINPEVPTLVSPVIESFENPSFPLNDADITKNWRYNAPPNAFSRVTTASVTGVASLRYRHSNAIDEGTASELISPAIDFDNVTGPTASISFKLAYARRSQTTNDKLEVWISVNCGRTWTRRYSKVGASLATVSTLVTGTFLPTADQWRTETINVTPLVGAANGMVKIVVIDSSGNDIYLEDINLVNAPVGINDPAIDEYMTTVFPNPGEGDATISFGLYHSERVKIDLVDVAGRTVAFKDYGNREPGDHSVKISDISGIVMSQGIYFIRIQAGQQHIIRKWICN